MILPLGLYRTRPTQLKTIARIFLERFKGNLPDEPQTLLSTLQGLGVGRYIVNAVFCLAEKRDLPMLDANSVRILRRVFGLPTAKRRPRDDPRFWEFLTTLIPRGRGRDLNLGLIDFGATVCTAHNPRCELCPLRGICVYYEYLTTGSYK
jgi:A/G-specific adenine glycosylase